MKFLFGSQNFGLDTPESDKDYMQFWYPSVGDLCKPIPHTKEAKQGDGSLVKHIDVRAIPGLFYKANLDTLQLLYSKKVEDGGEVEAYFRQYEHELSTINLPRLYFSVLGSALNRYKTRKTKDLAHIIFGFKTLIQFEKQGFEDLRKCFEHNENHFYQSVRSGEYSDWIPVAKHYEELACKLGDRYKSQEPNDAFKAQMDNDFGMMVVRHLNK